MTLINQSAKIRVIVDGFEVHTRFGCLNDECRKALRELRIEHMDALGIVFRNANGQNVQLNIISER